MDSKSKELYKKYRYQFESWFIFVHPNHDCIFDWISTHDSGWYKDPMVQGAWIAWIELTKKANIQNITLSLADKLIDNGDIDKVKTLKKMFDSTPIGYFIDSRIKQESILKLL